MFSELTSHLNLVYENICFLTQLTNERCLQTVWEVPAKKAKWRGITIIIIISAIELFVSGFLNHSMDIPKQMLEQLANGM